MKPFTLWTLPHIHPVEICETGHTGISWGTHWKNGTILSGFSRTIYHITRRS